MFISIYSPARCFGNCRNFWWRLTPSIDTLSLGRACGIAVWPSHASIRPLRYPESTKLPTIRCNRITITRQEFLDNHHWFHHLHQHRSPPVHLHQQRRSANFDLFPWRNFVAQVEVEVPFPDMRVHAKSQPAPSLAVLPSDRQSWQDSPRKLLPTRRRSMSSTAPELCGLLNVQHSVSSMKLLCFQVMILTHVAYGVACWALWSVAELQKNNKDAGKMTVSCTAFGVALRRRCFGLRDRGERVPSSPSMGRPSLLITPNSYDNIWCLYFLCHWSGFERLKVTVLQDSCDEHLFDTLDLNGNTYV